MSKGNTGNHDKLRGLLVRIGKDSNSHSVPNKAKFDENEFVESCLNFPASPHAQFFMFSRADQLLNEGKYKEAAQYYCKYQALTFKQQFLQQLNKKKLRTCLDVQKGKVSLDSTVQDGLKETENQILGMLDHHQESSVENMLKDLPNGWTVLQVSCYNSLKHTRFKSTKKDSAMQDGNPNLVFVRLTAGSDNNVVVSRVLSPEDTGATPYLMELQNILEEMVLLLTEATDDRNKYWNMRQRLNDRMQSLLKSVEDKWLGPVKTSLLGNLPSKEEEKVSQVYEEITQLLESSTQSETVENRTKLLLSGAKYLGQEQILSELLSLFYKCDQDLVISASNLISKYSKTLLDFEFVSREPVILLLDPELLGFPWESLPCVAANKQAMSRLPSLQYLATMWRFHAKDSTSTVNEGIANDSIFYILNPDKSLPKTQERLEGVLKGFKEWEGLTGEKPKPGQQAQVLSKKDAYIYAGHGGGTFISSEEIKKLRIRSVPILLGCRSVELVRLGRNLDPLGVVHSYLVGSSPAIAGFLWPVSDADLDQWTIEFLKYWVSGQEKNLLQAVADQRSKFTHLVNSAGLVVYGFPISMKSK